MAAVMHQQQPPPSPPPNFHAMLSTFLARYLSLSLSRLSLSEEASSSSATKEVTHRTVSGGRAGKKKGKKLAHWSCSSPASHKIRFGFLSRLSLCLGMGHYPSECSVRLLEAEARRGEARRGEVARAAVAAWHGRTWQDRAGQGVVGCRGMRVCPGM
ncbi:hypothetical protein BKA80DRAFT_22300 [Phyllosticta citrichinensis]